METKTGGCHCGAIRYEAKIDLSKPVIECNCSHCEAKSLLLAFIPRSDFTLLSDMEGLTEYRFNTKKIQHLFCKICGVQAFAFGTNPHGEETCAINIRSLDHVDLKSFDRLFVDGKSK